jgi:hypothetical protein
MKQIKWFKRLGMRNDKRNGLLPYYLFALRTECKYRIEHRLQHSLATWRTCVLEKEVKMPRIWCKSTQYNICPSPAHFGIWPKKLFVCTNPVNRVMQWIRCAGFLSGMKRITMSWNMSRFYSNYFTSKLLAPGERRRPPVKTNRIPNFLQLKVTAKWGQ